MACILAYEASLGCSSCCVTVVLRSCYHASEVRPLHYGGRVSISLLVKQSWYLKDTFAAESLPLSYAEEKQIRLHCRVRCLGGFRGGILLVNPSSLLCRHYRGVIATYLALVVAVHSKTMDARKKVKELLLKTAFFQSTVDGLMDCRTCSKRPVLPTSRKRVNSESQREMPCAQFEYCLGMDNSR